MDWALFLVPAIHLLSTPFTKVEESFNIQATHDIIYHGLNISAYDHNEFPGVVPRTFIGPLILSFVSAPLVFLSSHLGHCSKFTTQYIVRGVLFAFVAFSLLKFQKTLSARLGQRWGYWYILVTVTQYHLLYYSSRPLPNILVLPFVFLALAFALEPNKKTWFLVISGAAIIWFRTELAILLGIILLIQIYDNAISVTEVLKTVIPAGLGLIATTFLIDSIFWQRPVWPEAEVFFFNAILNKSSEWGTSPFLWYFYSALPRGLGASLFLIPVGLYYESRVRRLVLAGFLFILSFSFLPHKELRFIIYTFPLLNTAVAVACQRLWNNRTKSPIQWILGLGVVGHLILNSLLTIFLLMVARVNYPGGEAIMKLHELVDSQSPVYVHIGNLAAQTGVTRFTEINAKWRYSKEENLTPGGEETLRFTHLIVEAKSKYSPNLKPYMKTHNVIGIVEGFSEVVMNPQIIPPVRIKTKPQIFILERNPDFQPKESREIEELADFGEAIEDRPESESETDKPSFESKENNFENKSGIDRDGFGKEINDNVEDDLMAMASEPVLSEEEVEKPDSGENEGTDKGDTADLLSIVNDIEHRINSKEDYDNENFYNAVLDESILQDLKELTNIDFEAGKLDLNRLKHALKKVLDELKSKGKVTEDDNNYNDVSEGISGVGKELHAGESIDEQKAS